MAKITNSHSEITKLVRQLSEENCQKMLLLFGSCTAVFDGRIKSYLPLGDRLLIIKRDETLILHGATGLKPLNWQLPGAGKIRYLNRDGKLVVHTYRPKTKETLEIIFGEVYQSTIFDAHDSAKLSIYGSESDLSDYLFAHPDIIDENFQPTAREFETPFGFLDIRGVDREGNIIIIEVKKRAATPADAHQLKRYQEYFEEVENVEVQGILVAKKFSKKVMNILEAANLEALAIPWQEIFPANIKRKRVTIDQFFDGNNDPASTEHK
ncbi:MAG: DUF91 domain-containing protein [Candidatus Heimdallarchaeota archaeon]|nr:DUF91 domain-containing protein [Candidatus Heimdallarchaeota archaeon]